jgi:pimeloyl-ACP methyl ester carboxylesterase
MDPRRKSAWWLAESSWNVVENRNRWSAFALIAGFGCTSPTQNQSPPPGSQTGSAPSILSTETPIPKASTGLLSPVEVTTSPPAPPLATFPTDLPLHKPYEVTMEGDRDLRIAHAQADSLHAVVYLHGMCGDSRGADSWVDIATQKATVVTVRADVPCPDRPGYKWPQEPSSIQQRIDRALEHVKQLRAGHLETNVVTLIGYSQGAHRAERLAAAYPTRYRKLVLGGPPTPAEVELLAHTEAVAILGGELEDTSHMELGFAQLKAAGKNARFFLLPKAHHGGYGPEGRQVMSTVLDWLWGGP